MAYIYENDVGRLGGNLQKTVGYLLSLHKAEYEWNLLGIKVVGHVDALPIPNGTYEYGDAYTVGTAAPYDIWIYTRADEFHAEAYWFNIGKFPAPGPQGPKGDGIEQITREDSKTAKSVTYDYTSGATIDYAGKTLTYKDSTTGETKTQTYPAQLSLPIKPGKYIDIGTNADNNALEVKVDDTELALDYYKIDKSDYPAAIVPTYYKGKQGYKLIGYQSGIGTLVMRGGDSEIKCNAIDANYWRDIAGNQELAFTDVKSQLTNGSFVVPKTATDTGSISTSQLTVLKKLPQYQIQYSNKTYYRMDPLSAPDGTLNYVHLERIDDGNGGYKATVKCFSITVSTRTWKVVDLYFDNSTRTTHNLTLTNISSGTEIYFSLTNNRPETYEGAPAGLWSALQNSPISCTVNIRGYYSAGMITTEGDNFKVFYGSSEEMTITQTEMEITDSIV